MGASERASAGRSIVESLDLLGFDGQVYPINPRYENILGHRCYPSLAALPAPPDVVTYCISQAAVVESFRDLADCGAGAAVIYDGGFAERGPEGKRIQNEMSAVAVEAGIALCGPNCMGVLNPIARSTTFLQAVRRPSALSGNVGFITQSGSIAGSLLADLRRFGFSLVISSGNEAVVTSAAFLEYLVDDPATKVIAAFLESVREPDRFVAALDRAAAKDKPVIVLKVGKSERAQHAIQSHTGGLAGQSRVFSEVLRAHRAIEVSNLAEMTELICACQGLHWPRGRRANIVTTSGGMTEMILDVGSTVGLDFAPLPQHVRNEVAAGLGPFSGEGNPLDAWGDNRGASIPSVLEILSINDSTDSIVFCSGDSADDQALGREGREMGYCEILAAAARNSAKPHYLMTTRQNALHSGQVKFLAEAGVPVVCGTDLALIAIDRLAKWNSPQPASRSIEAAINLELAADRASINEYDAKRLFAHQGMPIAREFIITTPAEATKAAADIGYPVALKVVSDDIPHKSEHGLVKLDLAGEAELLAALADMQASVMRLGHATQGYLVQEMVEEGVEVFAGISRDPQYGLTIAFGMGGVAIDILRDFALRPLPLREGDAEAMIAEPRGAALLDAFRGRAAADKAALAHCLNRLADFAWANADRIAEIDINPIKVLPTGSGCVIVDALIITQRD
ncbi:MAG TPA: acetate--CoA ligase family protein, partial [Beijerinckiaceae bacterium]|nr:acetate--CoA ligase family protein [Beijerinckiaceae bacterium]